MHALFDRGQRLYEDRRFGDAARMFLAAYGTLPRPNLIYNAAVCYERMHDYDRAIVYFRRYLAETRDLSDRVAVETRIDALVRIR
jgi:hypothetical protein